MYLSTNNYTTYIINILDKVVFSIFLIPFPSIFTLFIFWHVKNDRFHILSSAKSIINDIYIYYIFF
jgi:hypothetical protein